MVVSDVEAPGIPLKDGVSFIVSMIDIVTVSGAFIGCPQPLCRNANCSFLKMKE
ncbi:hypothetical protein DPMN_089449 [Dreissena polymorpha]|uniref:Uncharacterized protein n=1 Tax=Dreissena polymorpha TaxID=45954 RepID=A0A9D4KWT4_DREPO|nr:hypothetical protein DPMN_089449 [Dreissena polymorpha]